MDVFKVLKDLGFSEFKPIGEGAYGTVYLAKCRRYQNKVAIKLMDPSTTDDPEIGTKYLPQEVSILKKLEHPNIIHVHEMYTMPTGQVIVVMDAAAMDLCHKMEELYYAVPMDLAKNWFCQILSAMIYLHDQDIAHRDIKWENILLTDDNQVKLTDFGLGCFSKGFPDLTDTCLGSLAYVAPEVLLGDYDAKKTDVWSLGVLLYMLVTGGETPYEAEDLNALLEAHEKPFTFPDGLEVEESCRSIISYMLQVNPLERPTMKEVAQHPWVLKQSETLSSVSQNQATNWSERATNFSGSGEITTRSHSSGRSETTTTMSNSSSSHEITLRNSSSSGETTTTPLDINISRTMEVFKVLNTLGFSEFKPIGEGAYGMVYLAKSRRYVNKVAIKIMDPSMTDDPEIGTIYLPQEVSILKKLEHPNIIHVNNMYTMPTGQVIVVMEAAAMDLFDKMEELDYAVPMDLAKNWFCQILSAMIYLHDQDIAHRDIKWENILLTADNQVKITNFGMGCFSKGFPDLTDTCLGSLAYVAPEVLLGDYDAKKTDVWSLGVLLYMLVTGGETPYEAEDLNALLEAHKKPFTFPDGLEVEESCRSIISYMLQVNPLERPTMKEVAQHPWVLKQSETLSSVSQTQATNWSERATNFSGRGERTNSSSGREMSTLEVFKEKEEKEEEKEGDAGKRAATKVSATICKALRSLRGKIRRIAERRYLV